MEVIHSFLDAQGLTCDRNLGFILAFMAFFLLAHVLAAEYVSGQPSKGDVVLFRRRRREDEVSALDIEKNLPIVGSSGSSNSSKWQSGESGLAVSSSTTVQDTYFTWNDLSYDVRIGGKPQRLLDDVDGWVQAGSLTALMVNKRQKEICVEYTKFSANFLIL